MKIWLARIFHELSSRDRETGNPLAGLSGVQRARIRWPCNRATVPRTAGLNPRRTERYVAGSDNRGRAEGLSDPRSQQTIREISWLIEVKA